MITYDFVRTISFVTDQSSIPSVSSHGKFGKEVYLL